MTPLRHLREFHRRNGAGLSLFLIGATGFWILFMIVLPQLFMADFSFRANVPPPKWGTPEHYYTLEHYRYMIYGGGGEGSFNVIDLRVFFKTIGAAMLVTLFDAALCYPIAWHLAQAARGGWARLMVLALVVPFWVNEILRAFAFHILFGASGVLNRALMAAGVLDEPYDFVRENIALYAGLGYAFILLMIFPIYNAMESLDKNQVEAARDLGASRWRIHRRVVMPHAKPGITSGCTMVFMLTAGALAAPQILGGPGSLWFTQIIYQAFNQAGNWARGSAYAIILLVSCIVLVLALMKAFKVRLGEIAR